jgi:glycosyltransferase involved in cell wall biosynthesis
MRILLVTDQYRGSDHSAIEAIFGRHLRRGATVERVYFDRDIAHAERTDDSRLILPHRCRRSGLLQALGGVVELSAYDIVVVRNLFPVLRAILAGRIRHGYRVAFWDSFPHAYRRRFEAERTGRARLRKALEYRWRHRTERRLLATCDAYLPITAAHRELFFPELRVPTHPLPMGFDFGAFPHAAARPARQGPTRFIYAGTIDRLRRMDTVLEGFRGASGEFELHLYTPASEATRQILGLQDDPRFVFHEPVPRAELMRRIAAADVGVSLIPPEKLYIGSSPTKTLEYYAAGVPALLSELADHRALFDQDSAFFAEFGAAAIAEAVTRATRCPRPQIDAMGLRGRERVREQRDYARLAAELLEFFVASDRAPT